MVDDSVGDETSDIAELVDVGSIVDDEISGDGKDDIELVRVDSPEDVHMKLLLMDEEDLEIVIEACVVDACVVDSCVVDACVIAACVVDSCVVVPPVVDAFVVVDSSAVKEELETGMLVYMVFSAVKEMLPLVPDKEKPEVVIDTCVVDSGVVVPFVVEASVASSAVVEGLDKLLLVVVVF